VTFAINLPSNGCILRAHIIVTGLTGGRACVNGNVLDDILKQLGFGLAELFNGGDLYNLLLLVD
jgi:hypothetical protein